MPDDETGTAPGEDRREQAERARQRDMARPDAEAAAAEEPTADEVVAEQAAAQAGDGGATSPATDLADSGPAVEDDVTVAPGAGARDAPDVRRDEPDEPDHDPPAGDGLDEDELSDDDEDAEDELDDERRRPSWALTIALGAVAAVAVVALAVTTLLVPGWAVRPGSPDATAERVTTALAARDAGELEAVSCRDRSGRTTNPFPPDALPLIAAVRASGPPRTQLDTQAVAPVDLTLSAQGQTQDLPADVVLAVTDGDWCMAGVSQRQ